MEHIRIPVSELVCNLLIAINSYETKHLVPILILVCFLWSWKSQLWWWMLVVPQTHNQPHCQAKKTCFVALGAIKVIVAANATTFSQKFSAYNAVCKS